MADLTNYTPLPTVQSIYRLYESRRQSHRPHLGASQIGASCDRFLWYLFRWADHDMPDGRVLRLFDHGNAEEDRLVRDLRHAGYTVYSQDPDTGQQFTFTAFDGHFGCSLDGAIQGIPESSKWHLLEVKTANAKSFAQLKRDGLEKWSPKYYAQVLIGMELAELERALHLTVNKDSDDLYGERVRAQPKRAHKLLDRAERVIFSEDPLERISDRPDWYECKWCAMWHICHGARVAEVNCRTCVHSTPMRNGTWHCARHDKTLTTKEQRAGCDRHLMRPSLVPYAEAVDAGEDWIEYGTGFSNHADGVHGGRHCYTSHELRASRRQLPLDETAEQARVEFGATVEGYDDPA